MSTHFPIIFRKVWYRSAHSGKSRWRLTTYQDIGILTIEENRLQFVGRRTNLIISSISEIGVGAQGNDFINAWVNVQSEEGTACFANGGWWGWRAHIADGNRKILRAIMKAFPEPAAKLEG
jgi:hypothetical protein